MRPRRSRQARGGTRGAAASEWARSSRRPMAAGARAAAARVGAQVAGGGAQEEIR